MIVPRRWKWCLSEAISDCICHCGVTLPTACISLLLIGPARLQNVVHMRAPALAISENNPNAANHNGNCNTNKQENGTDLRIALPCMLLAIIWSAKSPRVPIFITLDLIKRGLLIVLVYWWWLATIFLWVGHFVITFNWVSAILVIFFLILSFFNIWIIVKPLNWRVISIFVVIWIDYVSLVI